MCDIQFDKSTTKNIVSTMRITQWWIRKADSFTFNVLHFKTYPNFPKRAQPNSEVSNYNFNDSCICFLQNIISRQQVTRTWNGKGPILICTTFYMIIKGINNTGFVLLHCKYTTQYSIFTCLLYIVTTDFIQDKTTLFSASTSKITAERDILEFQNLYNFSAKSLFCFV